MELKILRLIYDYSINRKLLDSKFIDKLIEIVVTERSLHEFVNNVRFTNELDKNDYSVVCATYNPLNKEIIIDYDSINIILEDKSYYEQLFFDLEQIFYRNLIITQIILHELEHAFQNKQLDNKKDDSIEAKLVKASFVLEQVMKHPKFLNAILKGEISSQDIYMYVMQNRELYKQYYKFNPTERLAEVNSYTTIINTIEPIKKYIPNLLEFEKASMVEESLKGYKDIDIQEICPTQVYLCGTRQDKVWSGFDFYDQDSSKLIKHVCGEYNLAKRLSLGLPVTVNEYYDTYSWLQTTNKFNI